MCHMAASQCYAVGSQGDAMEGGAGFNLRMTTMATGGCPSRSASGCATTLAMTWPGATRPQHWTSLALKLLKGQIPPVSLPLPCYAL